MIEERLRILELDIEPESRKSEGFETLSKEMDLFKEQVNKRFDKLEHGQNQLKASLEQFKQDTRETLALILKRLSGE